MHILLVEPYHTGSHADWAQGYARHSRHQVEVLRLAGANWKWRMHGGAVTLARRFNESDMQPDLVLATDMLDVTTFQALTRHATASVPFAIYFHENQLTYPWSPTDRDVLHQRDKHYGFINYASAMACDRVFFNSKYHMESFLDELVRLLKHFPDHNELASVDALRARSQVLPLGLDLARFDDHLPVGNPGDTPLILWNHRWEYDKNPDAFFQALGRMAAEGYPFRVAVLGENFSQSPEAFEKGRVALGDRVVAYGYAQQFADYAAWLRAADILPVTSNQDFFGASIVEAVYCGASPLLPRRLAYPELIPESEHDAVFYDEGGLDKRVRDLVSAPQQDTSRLQEFVAGFDWAVMAPRYDDTFEAMIHS